MNNFEISGNIVDILSETIYAGTIFVENGKIKNIVKSTKSFPNYIMPGFVDAHIHIESSMLPPSEFARLASVHGTVATVSDPHEIANVLGVKGVEWMIENAKEVPFKIFFGVPSCVPATTFETSGAIINADEVKFLFEKYNLKYLSEMMNFPGVIYSDSEVLKKLDIAKSMNKPIDGHIPGISGADLSKYIASGITTDHECFTKEEALEKVKQGMKILIREGSAAKNYEALSPILEDYPDMCMFCTDDSHPDTLSEMHIKDTVIRALDNGYDFMNVLKAAILNPIKHYSLEVGLLQKDDFADFIVVDNFQNFNVLKSYIDGELIVENGKTLIEHKQVMPINVFNANAKNESDFELLINQSEYPVIVAKDGELITERMNYQINEIGKDFQPNINDDILKIAVINRYQDTKPAVALIHNIGIKKGAIATTVAHDSHNIIAVGVDNFSICKAVNSVIESKGGMSVYDGESIHHLPLPIAGLMSDQDGYEVAAKYRKLQEIVAELGSPLMSPFMTLSFMALLVIPKIKLSDKGLFDGEKFDFIK